MKDDYGFEVACDASKCRQIKIQDIIHWIFIVFISAFLGAPLLMVSLRWWQSLFWWSQGGRVF